MVSDSLRAALAAKFKLFVRKLKTALSAEFRDKVLGRGVAGVVDVLHPGNLGHKRLGAADILRRELCCWVFHWRETRRASQRIEPGCQKLDSFFRVIICY